MLPALSLPAMAKHSANRHMKPKHRSTRHKNLPAAVAKQSFPSVPLLKREFGSLLNARFGRLEAAIEKRFSEVSRAMEAKMAPLERRLKLHDGPHATKAVVSLPEFQKKDVQIHLTDHSLTVSAQGKGASFYQSMSLPFLIVPEKAKADFKGGKLTVVLPKYKERVEGGRKLKL